MTSAASFNKDENGKCLLGKCLTEVIKKYEETAAQPCKKSYGDGNEWEEIDRNSKKCNTVSYDAFSGTDWEC